MGTEPTGFRIGGSRIRIAARSVFAVVAVCTTVGALVHPAAGAEAFPPGPHNSITDVPGVLVGHNTRAENVTGTTAVVFPKGATAGAAPSGGAPGDRATEALRGESQDTFRSSINGILLNGGSIFGLDAACGLVKFIQEKFGIPNPLVPAAIIYDLARGNDYNPAQANAEPKPNNCGDAYQAAKRAKSGRVEQGSVGVGTGANSGGVKGGIGTASADLGDGYYVGALVVVNSAGQTYSPRDCRLFALYLEKNNEFGSVRRPPSGCGAEGGAAPMARPYDNTTIGVIATNVPLTGGQVQRLAIAGNDGMARAMNPSRTPLDGDTIFAVSTGTGSPPMLRATQKEARRFQSLLGEASDAWARAIVHAIINAKNLGTSEPYCEQYPSACPKAGRQAGAIFSSPNLAAESHDFDANQVAHRSDMSPSVIMLVLIAASGVGLALIRRWRRGPAIVGGGPRSRIGRRVRGLVLSAVLVSAVLTPGRAMPQSAFPSTGPTNTITDVPGLLVGHETFTDRATGTTVLQMPQGSLVGAASSGGAAANRVTEILKAQFQDTMRTDIYGLLLNGGSVHGLDAACGLIRYLQEVNRGIVFGTSVVPIVPGAAIDDLGRGRDYVRGRALSDKKPNDCDVGYRAAESSTPGPIEQGTVGAGTGAMAGGITGGVGSASAAVGQGIYVGALVVVNSLGKPYNVQSRCELFALEYELGDEFGPVRAPTAGCKGDRAGPTSDRPGQFGTIGVLATNMPLTGGQAERLAEVVADGVARAVYPSHTPFDGDTIYAVSTSKGTPAPLGATFADAVPYLVMQEAAVDAYTRAIGHAILGADPSGPGQTYCERFPTACPGLSQGSPSER